MMHSSRAGLWLILVTFVSLALAWNITIPPYENLDEIEHAEVIRHIAVTGRLPVHGEAEAAGFHVRQEASQPPLYHLLGAAWVRLRGLPREAPDVRPIPATFVACGSGDTLYNRVTWSRDPYTGFPPEGHRRTVYALRLLSTLLQCATVAGTWALARRLAPRGFVAPLATAVVAFNPQFLLLAAGVNNDNLVIPLATWALVLLVDIWQRGPTPTRLLGFGILTGLAALSKLSGLGLLGLGGLTLLAYAWRQRAPLTRLLRWGVLLVVPALALVAPWLGRNWRLYGDLTALAPMLDVVGRTAVRVDLWGTFQLMLRSYWGQLPCAFYPRALYWPFFALLGGGCVGLVAHFRTLARRTELALLGGWFVIIVVAWVRWNALTPATGGRLLFPAAPALAVLLAVGWQQLQPRLARAWAIWLPLGALITLLAGAAPLFAPPARLEDSTPLPHTTDVVFGAEAIALRGYEVQLTESRLACWLVQSSYCRPALELQLYLEALRPLDEEWALAVQLVSARPGDNTLRLTYDAWPGHGNLPTSAWPAGTLLREKLLLPLPASDLPTQAWELHLAFYDGETKARLPVTLAGQPAGDAARLDTLRIQGSQPPCDTLPPLEMPARFGEALALTHAALTERDDAWEVTLCWESLAPVDADYTVFVHACAADGALLATGDAPPMGQAFPTHLWLPGDRVLDSHRLTAAEAPVTIAVGLYHPETGARLAAFVGAERQPNDALVLWSR